MEQSWIEQRSKETKTVGLVGIIANIFLFIIKITVSLATSCQSLLADSINSGTDILSSLMTFIGGKIAGEPSDEGHNYGHGKAEYIFSLIISIIMGYLALKIAFDGVNSLIVKNQLEFSMALVIVCLITIFTKFILYFYTNMIGRQTNNILVLANSKDHINDVYTTMSVLAGVLATKLGIYWLDGVVAVLISIRIFYTAVEFFMESYNVLLDAALPEEELVKIKEVINSYPEIKHIDKITSKATGTSFIVIIKVSVDGNMTVKESHDIVGKMKAELLTKDKIHDVIVHVNPS